MIIPEWLIIDSWSIAILFRWFLELPKKSVFTGPDSPYSSCKYFKTYKKKGGIISEKYYLFIPHFSGPPICLTCLYPSNTNLFVSYFEISPQTNPDVQLFFMAFFMECFWKMHNFDKRIKHKQILIIPKCFWKSHLWVV